MSEYPSWEQYRKGERDISDLVGKTIVGHSGLEVESDEIRLTCSDGSRYLMYHRSDCCECVQVQDVIGDPADLLGTVLDARMETNSESHPADYEPPKYEESYTWTFYIIQTDKGAITLRWLGESNGYYSEEVDFVLLNPPSENAA